MVADIDANGWVLIIGAVFLGVSQILNMVLTYLRSRMVEGKVDMARDVAVVTAKKVEQNSQSITRKLEENTDLTRQAKDAANGLTDRLVEATAIAASAAGKEAGRAEMQAEIGSNVKADVEKIKMDFSKVWHGLSSRGFVEAKLKGCMLDNGSITSEARKLYEPISCDLKVLYQTVKESLGREPTDDSLTWAIEQSYQTWMVNHACPYLGINSHGCLAIAAVIAREPI